MLKKICEVCGKEERVDIEDNIYFIHLGSRNLGYEEIDEAKEIRNKDSNVIQGKQICEKCIKKLGFAFNKQRSVKK